jgi:large subunit ribosomal protein L3
MKMGILGRKVGMTQIFDGNGLVVPITVVDTSDCFITQVKTKETDGYTALQLAIGSKKPQNVIKSTAGHFKKASVPAKSHVKEIRLTENDSIAHLKPGQSLSVAMFTKGDRVDVVGKTKGKGFQGVIKSHGFKGKDASHGTHEYFRHGGSIGTNTFPGRTLKNKGMPRQHGNWPRTIQNIEVVEVREKENLLFLKGAVPGFKDRILMIRSAGKSPSPGERSWTT